MSQYLSKAAQEFWEEVGQKVDRPLRDKMREGHGEDCLDAWVAQAMQVAGEMAEAMPCQGLSLFALLKRQGERGV